MTRAKEIAVVVAVTSVLAGCLFPSFDDLGDGERPVVLGSGDAGADREASPPSNDAGTTSENSQTPPAPKPTNDSGTAPTPEIACGGTQLCNAAVDHCCFTLGGPDCQPHGSAGTCGAQAGSGDIIGCDGAEDCTGGDSCCYVAGEKKASCRSSCTNGKILCNGPQKLCGSGQGQCNGTVSIGSPSSVNYRFCQ